MCVPLMLRLFVPSSLRGNPFSSQPPPPSSVLHFPRPAHGSPLISSAPSCARNGRGPPGHVAARLAHGRREHLCMSACLVRRVCEAPSAASLLLLE